MTEQIPEKPTHTLAANMMLLASIGRLWWGASGMKCTPFMVTTETKTLVAWTNFKYHHEDNVH